MLAVYDLILASHSRYFAACASGSGCSPEERSRCARCNYFGNFALVAAGMRNETLGHAVSTFDCWNPR